MKTELSKTEPANGVPSPTSWVQRMRAAAEAAIGEGDVRAIIAKQIEKAKAGDERAAKFVLDVIVGKSASMTLVQNNFDGTPAARPAATFAPARNPFK